jgi:hypothetical protein|tara:strand:+ start:860 stop:1075 length:216 start_codon:yes stop_codon:yes gene_type:complete
MSKKFMLSIMKEYFRKGGHRSSEIVKKSGGSKFQAKEDVKAGISNRLKNLLKTEKDPLKKKTIIKSINKLK